MSSIEEYFREGFSGREKRELHLAEMKISVTKLIRRLDEESLFIKTIIDSIEAGLLIYNLADEINVNNVIVVLDWSGIHVMSKESMIKRLANFLLNFKHAELNYYTIQLLGILIRNKEHYQEIFDYIAENLNNELPDCLEMRIDKRKRIIINRIEK